MSALARMGFSIPGRGPAGLKALMEMIPVSQTWDQALVMSRTARAILYEFVHGYGEGRLAYDSFKLDWLVLRLGVALQVRLMVEQILYERGEPWRNLVSGFGPVGD